MRVLFAEWRNNVGKGKYGYTQKKLQEKADKRGVTIEAYLNYLSYRARFRGSRERESK